ncbi:hypothetical protein ACP70R_042325 [Stipagrostis hirtigluma subsp. patula]
MRRKVIEADTIDAAVERILDELKEDPGTTRSLSTRNNVIYFDGWDGLGASAVLRAVAQRLAASTPEAPAGLHFDQIIHIDCSKWESRRALQRAIAEQLELPAEVMEVFDVQDEEDDYNGADQVTRSSEIPQVVREMYERIQKLNRRFLVIFHNGSDEEIDLASFCGFPLSGYSTSKVLWTFQGRFRLKPRMKVESALNKSVAGSTDIFLLPATPRKELWSYLVSKEAADLVVSARKNNRNHGHGHGPGSIIDQPEQVIECFLYMWKLCGMVHHFRMDYDLATHCSNYWICDGIIQQQQGQVGSDDDGPWQAAHALQREMRLDVDYHSINLHQPLPSHLEHCAESMVSMPNWTSPTFLCNYTGNVLFFPAGDMFQDFSKLGVLKLSHCTFSLSSPPFLRCHNLRFLWLDHCQDHEISSTDGVGREDICRQSFQKLWVLDVHQTCCDRILSARMMDLMTQLRELNVMGVQDWDMGQLQGRLPNIRKLRVTKSTIHCISCSENDLFLGMSKLELLDFSGNCIMSGMRSLTVAANNSSSVLETIIIDEGCVGLEQISCRGCAKLENVLLRGLFDKLYSLDMSGTAVKMLDLGAMTAQKLYELVLLDYDKLCAILWPPADKRKEYLSKLHIETTMQSASTSRTREFRWYISVRDARILRSLVPFKEYFDTKFIHVEISSPSRPAVDVCSCKEERTKSSIGNARQVIVNMQQQQPPPPPEDNTYVDVSNSLLDHLQHAREGQIWAYERETYSSGCYIHIQDQPMGTKLSLSGEVISTTINIPDIICNNLMILHVHDSLSITHVPGPAPPLEGSRWRWLRWCRVERCPSLDHVFTSPHLGGGYVLFFGNLETFWASQLPKARFIWNWSRPTIHRIPQGSFLRLNFLHLDFCPRLIHVLPLPMSIFLENLETLEIMWCGDLREVFHFEADAKGHHEQQQLQAITVEFWSLRRIHLHELPMLQGICGRWRMSAPKLETVKIRGCWSLTRLPAIRRNRSNKVECDCEKEWWDRLEWDMKPNHCPSLYKPTHSRYYKKKFLRSSALR